MEQKVCKTHSQSVEEGRRPRTCLFPSMMPFASAHVRSLNLLMRTRLLLGWRMVDSILGRPRAVVQLLIVIRAHDHKDILRFDAYLDNCGLCFTDVDHSRFLSRPVER